MKVLVACEFSGIVRDAFRTRGHEAYSCDLLPSLKPSAYHKQRDVTMLLRDRWDLVIAHPPCTHLANSGVRWYKSYPIEKRLALLDSAKFFLACYNANSNRVAVENPIMHVYGKKAIDIEHTQIIQPWMFGHGETKATCLWLSGLPMLEPTNVVEGREARVHKMYHKHQKHLRSITLQGIADAMAEQWG
jgi:hypothetical protein